MRYHNDADGAPILWERRYSPGKPTWTAHVMSLETVRGSGPCGHAWNPLASAVCPECYPWIPLPMAAWLLHHELPRMRRMAWEEERGGEW